jgi:hypothetical protein
VLKTRKLLTFYIIYDLGQPLIETAGKNAAIRIFRVNLNPKAFTNAVFTNYWPAGTQAETYTIGSRQSRQPCTAISG